MPVRKSVLVALVLLSVGSVGCSRPWKREPQPSPVPPKKLPDPQPIAGLQPVRAEEPARPPAVKPPQFDLAPGSVPALPGLPKATIPNSISDSPPLAEPFVDPAEPVNAPLSRSRPPAAPPVPPPAPSQKLARTKDESTVAEVRKLLDSATKTYAEVPDYEAKLVRREVVAGKPQPTEELTYAHRKEPFAVYMKVTGEVGAGREVLYVKGQNAGKMIVVTGKGDSLLLGTGKRMELEPDSPLATGKSRARITDAGMGKMLATITKYVEQAEGGKRPADTVKLIGPTEGVESKMALSTIEITLRPGDEPLLPKGGARTYGFDADRKSPSFGLPVQIVTLDDKGKEVEFYSFSAFKVPAKFTDADFSPDRLGGKKK